MDSFIYIDRVVMTAIVIILVMAFILVVHFGNLNIKLTREHNRNKQIINDLKKKLSAAEDRLYRAKFKVPDIDEDYHDVMNKSELGGEGDV